MGEEWRWHSERQKRLRIEERKRDRKMRERASWRVGFSPQAALDYFIKQHGKRGLRRLIGYYSRNESVQAIADTFRMSLLRAGRLRNRFGFRRVVYVLRPEVHAVVYGKAARPRNDSRNFGSDILSQEEWLVLKGHLCDSMRSLIAAHDVMRGKFLKRSGRERTIADRIEEALQTAETLAEAATKGEDAARNQPEH